MRNPIDKLSNSYSDSLLFQFILAELLRVHHNIESLKTILKEYHSSIESLQSLTEIHHETSQAKKLIGFPRTQESASFLQSFYQSQKKLKEYTLLFQQDENQRGLSALKRQVRKAWMLALELLDLSQNSDSLKVFETTFAKNLKAFNSLKQPILKLIPQFRDDENVVYFLLSQQIALDGVFGRFFTVNQLISMHSSLQKSGQFLLKSYEARKFYQLLPLISKKIADLESPESHPLEPAEDLLQV